MDLKENTASVPGVAAPPTAFPSFPGEPPASAPAAPGPIPTQMQQPAVVIPTVTGDRNYNTSTCKATYMIFITILLVANTVIDVLMFYKLVKPKLLPYVSGGS